MNITFTPSEPQAVTKENVTVGGVVIGYVEYDPDRRPKNPYFAVVNVIPGNTNGMAYGFGLTREDAIQAALATGKSNAEMFLTNIAILTELINAK